LHLSARAYHRVLKLARAIGDLAGSEMIAESCVAEAAVPAQGGDVASWTPNRVSFGYLPYWLLLAKRKSILDKYVIVCICSWRGRYQILNCDM
jgi:hypothetical protein